MYLYYLYIYIYYYYVENLILKINSLKFGVINDIMIVCSVDVLLIHHIKL